MKIIEMGRVVVSCIQLLKKKQQLNPPLDLEKSNYKLLPSNSQNIAVIWTINN